MKEIATNIDRLREIALDQHGLVTTEQAMDVGVSKASLSMLVKRDRLARMAHGVYRVPQVPETQYTRYMLALLWTGAPEATLSHETALAAYDVCDVNPSTIHITVSKNRRIKRNGGDAYTLHYQDLDPEMVSWWEQIPIVTLKTTLEQCVKLGTPDYLLTQAIEKSARLGLLVIEEIKTLSEDITKRNERYARSHHPE